MIVEFHVLCHNYVEMDIHKRRQLFPVNHVDVRTMHEMDFDGFHCVHYKWHLFQMFVGVQSMLFVEHFDQVIFELRTVCNRLREEFLSLYIDVRKHIEINKVVNFLGIYFCLFVTWNEIL